jgi:hypothetical protein
MPPGLEEEDEPARSWLERQKCYGRFCKTMNNAIASGQFLLIVVLVA